MIFNPAWADAISANESGGRYGILGPVTRTGDRAYGKYQVMGANIGPWTKEVLGRSMTPQEFVSNPAAQDAVFKAKFGQYADKYGPEGAAKAWFAGEKGMNNPNAKDVLGTSVAAYANKFSSALGQPAQVGQAVTQERPPQLGQSAPQQTAPSQSLPSAAPIQAQQPPQLGGLDQLLSPSPAQAPRRVNVTGLLNLLQNASPQVRGLLLQG